MFKIPGMKNTVVKIPGGKITGKVKNTGDKNSCGENYRVTIPGVIIPGVKITGVKIPGSKIPRDEKFREKYS